MNRLCTAFAIAVLLVTGTFAPIRAVPPTVTPSPGYDARLQESRKAATAASPLVVDPVTPQVPNAPRRHPRRKQ